MTERVVEFLDPARRLVRETADWLCGAEGRPGRVRTTPEGALSLAHVMVAVPTAQSARNLRLAIAERFPGRGVEPPAVLMPGDALKEDGVRTATEAEELAALASLLLSADLAAYPALFPNPPKEKTRDWALDTAELLLGVASILGEGALVMSGVECPEDADRWRELAGLERDFFAALAAKGAKPRALSRRDAALAGCADRRIEEIVLPGAVWVAGAFLKYVESSRVRVTVLIHADPADAAKFDEWGRAKEHFAAPIAPRLVSAAPTAVAEADDVARFFREVDPADALPALAVCDAEMFPELEGAFQNRFAAGELVLRNPSRTPFANSSLGRLLLCLLELSANEGYDEFSTFIRSGDAARWAADAFGVPPATVARWVGALDAVQNAHFPQTVDEVAAGAESDALTAFAEADREAAAGLAKLARAVKADLADPFAFLRKIFSSLTLDEKNPSDRELAAAAEVVRDLRAECASGLVPESMRRALFAHLLKKASFMLEPSAERTLAALGWLEVAWCDAAELVVAGFNEGCVPESVVGHPFVPDSLRSRLGLTTNASRTLRDAFVLAEAVRCREPGAVRIHLHQMSGDKDVMKPSRLVFPGVGDDDLPALARRLYAVSKGGGGAPKKELPPAWRLRLPFPPEGVVYPKKISPTALDQYLRCPFEYFLRETFGERAGDAARELDARAFGTLCHGALDDFAKEGPKDSADEREIAAYLRDAVRRRLAAFGGDLPAVLELQGESAAWRLGNFAARQAARRREGWRIVAAERTLQCLIKGRPTLIRGKLDRVDENERTGELAVIDYKTWDRPKNDPSVQLPLYRAMLEASGLYGAERAHRAKAFYCILAARAEDVAFDVEHAAHEGTQSEAEDLVGSLLDRIARGIFYPPAKDSRWRDDYGELIWERPEDGLDPAWLEDQSRRLAAWEEEV